MRSSCWYISLLNGIDCYSNEKTNFREMFSIFQEIFVKFYLKIGYLILIFEKVQMKIVNVVIWGKKLNARTLRETNLFFILALWLLYTVLYWSGPPGENQLKSKRERTLVHFPFIQSRSCLDSKNVAVKVRSLSIELV